MLLLLPRYALTLSSIFPLLPVPPPITVKDSQFVSWAPWEPYEFIVRVREVKVQAS